MRLIAVAAAGLALTACSVLPTYPGHDVTIQYSSKPVWFAERKSPEAGVVAGGAGDLPPKTKEWSDPLTTPSAPGIKPGDGHAYVYPQYRTARTKDEAADLIRANDRKILRVDADTLMRHVADRLGRGSWESRSAFAEWLKSDAVSAVPCTPALLERVSLGRVSGGKDSEKVFDFSWRRSRCDPKETFLVFEGKPFLSTTCLNPAFDAGPHRKAAVSAAPPVSAYTPISTGKRCEWGHLADKLPPGYSQVVICLWAPVNAATGFEWGGACESRGACRKELYEKGALVGGSRGLVMEIGGVSDRPTSIVVNGLPMSYPGGSGTIPVPLEGGIAAVGFDRAWFCEKRAGYVVFPDPAAQGLRYPGTEVGKNGLRYFTRPKSLWRSDASELCEGFVDKKWTGTRLNLVGK